eukprot:CAMPEP_0179233616 /NCGR_PEP_ID=MMETSP0797-20121207/12466_1 /TAXON_ID=47934 /ORGANISM="Dinophysis acuminata, Strain DAEP01" /LENGTH=257 /DNA_ID=CAMNT_0020940771 /DNA_START=347 /DNA_END=1117 /DNA_ORIENTATION=+
MAALVASRLLSLLSSTKNSFWTHCTALRKSTCAAALAIPVFVQSWHGGAAGECSVRAAGQPSLQRRHGIRVAPGEVGADFVDLVEDGLLHLLVERLLGCFCRHTLAVPLELHEEFLCLLPELVLALDGIARLEFEALEQEDQVLLVGQLEALLVHLVKPERGLAPVGRHPLLRRRAVRRETELHLAHVVDAEPRRVDDDLLRGLELQGVGAVLGLALGDAEGLLVVPLQGVEHAGPRAGLADAELQVLERLAPLALG